MKHEKEWYTCDRCGATIDKIPSDGKWHHFLHKRTYKPTELEVLTADKNGFVANTELISPEIASVEICEVYDEKRKNIHLCGQCRKAFEQFMKMV